MMGPGPMHPTEFKESYTIRRNGITLSVERLEAEMQPNVITVHIQNATTGSGMMIELEPSEAWKFEQYVRAARTRLE
jgi:hypothetical protein